MAWVYSQKSGELSRDGALVGIGYSGHGDGVNNPELETVPDVGPIPCGTWRLAIIKGDDGLPCDYEGKKAPVMRIEPDLANTFGRAGFLMHGDLVGGAGEDLASKGCIVVTKYVRVVVANAIAVDGDDQLTVTP